MCFKIHLQSARNRINILPRHCAPLRNEFNAHNDYGNLDSYFLVVKSWCHYRRTSRFARAYKFLECNENGSQVNWTDNRSRSDLISLRLARVAIGLVQFFKRLVHDMGNNVKVYRIPYNILVQPQNIFLAEHKSKLFQRNSVLENIGLKFVACSG